MALFLNEAAQYGEPVLTVEEAHLGLLEAVTHMAALNEAILVADFTIHEKHRGLEESVLQEAEAGFFKKVADSVVAFLKKVKERVVAFFRAIGEKLKALWAKLTGGAASIKVPKNGPAQLDKVVTALGSLETAVLAEGKAAAYTKTLEKAHAAFETTAAAASKAVNADKATKSFVEVKVSALSKIQAAANTQSAMAGKSGGQLEAQIKAAEKAANAKDADDAAKEDLAFARAKASGYTKLAGSAGKLSGLISSIIAARSSGEAANGIRSKAPQLA